MTMAACDEESFSVERAQMIDSVKNYEYAENGQVVRFLSPARGPIYLPQEYHDFGSGIGAFFQGWKMPG